MATVKVHPEVAEALRRRRPVVALDPAEVDAIVKAANDRMDATQTPHAPSQRTPLLLAAVQDGTAGRALDANIVLLAANASLAARVAVALESE